MQTDSGGQSTQAASTPAAEVRFHTPTSAPEKFEKLYRYCGNDVEVERNVGKRLRPLIPFEQALWVLDQRINQRGMTVDAPAAAQAMQICQFETERLDALMERVTHGDVGSTRTIAALAKFLNIPKVDKASLLQYLATPEGRLTDEQERKLKLIEALADRPGTPGEAAAAIAARERILETCRLSPAQAQAAAIRLEAARSSTAKLKRMLETKCADDRIRGMLQFHGASTGRWTGRGVQPQNFPRGTLELERWEQDLILNNLELIDAYGAPPLSIIADCLRGFLMAAPGHELHDVDYSSIEARILAYAAGDTEYLKVFAGHGKVYEYEASLIYKVALETIAKSDPRRQIGKIAVLALGYQGGPQAFLRFAKAYGVKISFEEAQAIVWAWRAAHPAIQSYWRNLEEAAILAVTNPGRKYRVRDVIFRTNGSFLLIRLPSGRDLAYPYPRVEKITTPWGSQRDAVTAMTVDGQSHKWLREPKYGGLWAENVVQAWARDIMADGMTRASAVGWHIVLTVHDQLVTEEKIGMFKREDLEALLVQSPHWCKGLPLAVMGSTGRRFAK